MPRDSYSALQNKIEKEIAKLQKRADALRAKRRLPVITSIVRSMREYAITPEEITAALNKKSGKTPTRPGTTATGPKRPVPIKYKHPQTGETWTGRGRTPRWVTKAEAEGKQRADFLVNK